MSDLPPGAMIELRVIRRFGAYNVGELITEPPGAARELVAKRLATDTGRMKVPLPATPETPPPAPPEGATAGPVRQPAQLVRK